MYTYNIALHRFSVKIFILQDASPTAEGSPGELTALELEELFGIHLSIDMYMCGCVLREDVEPAIPSEHDDVDQGRSSEQDSFRGCTKIQFYTLQA